MKKSVLVIIACLFSVFVFQAFTTSHEPHFTNLEILPKDISDELRKHYFFYDWDESRNEMRLVCSWDTTQNDINNLCGVVFGPL